MIITRYIPNTLTLINLLCGCLLIYFTIHTVKIDQIATHSTWINTMLILLIVALVCDVLDGMLARLWNVSSPIGLQLDSLADMVTFGVFPGILMVKMLSNLVEDDVAYWAILGFGITLFSALRLAKFNLDLTQKSYFKGLATPSNTLLIFGILVLKSNFTHWEFLNNLWLLLGLTVVSCALLVSNLPLFSFKFSAFSFKNWLPQILLLIASLVLIIFWGLNALSPIILIYILLSILFKKYFVYA